MLAIDNTLFFQIGLFIVLWLFLRHFLFAPHLAVVEERTQRSEGALQEARQVRAAAEAAGGKYRVQLTEARTGTMQDVDAVYREAEEQARQVTESARTDVAQTLATMRESLRDEITAARQELETRTPDFARSITETLLGRPLT
ncbi:MAG: ATP synthase F0 subunit B [Candidatus Binatia bacterium]